MTINEINRDRQLAWNETKGFYLVKLCWFERLLKILPDCLLRLTTWGSQIADTKFTQVIKGQWKKDPRLGVSVKEKIADIYKKRVGPIELESVNTVSPTPVATKNLPATIGIPNIGNSCYLNSLLQSIVSSPTLVQQIQSSKKVKNQKLLNALRDFINAYQAKRDDLHSHAKQIREILFELDPVKFENGLDGQHDAFDFLITVLDLLDLSGFKVIESVPSGFMTVPYTTLDVSLSGTLENSLDDLFDRMKMEDFPDVLPIRVKRYDNDMKYLQDPIQIPQRLDMAPYYVRANHRPVVYQLKAVILQQGGSIHGGHYVAYVQENGRWKLANDSQVTSAKLSDLQTGYAFIYEKV